MKALLAGLVIAALIATTVADIEEYSADTVNRMNQAELVIDDEREAELINSNTRLQFTLQEEPQDDGIIMQMTSVVERAPQEDVNICGNWIGVRLEQGREYLCNITDIIVEVSYALISGNVHNMQIMLLLNHGSMEQALLDIPIMRIPSSVNPDNLLTWARDNHVGIISPVSMDQLDQFHGSQQLTLDFIWLRELLRFGVKKSRQPRAAGDGGEIAVYVPRPLLLSDDIISKLWEEVDWFKFDEGSEDTDDLSQLDGLAMLNVPRGW